MQQIHLQLYARTADEDFSEQVSVRRTITLTAEPTLIELAIEAPAHKKFSELRLDPDDKPSSFSLLSLTVRGADGADLVTWDGQPTSIGKLVDIEAVTTEGQVVLESATDDPFFLIPLPEPQTGVVVEMAVMASILGDHPKELAAAVRSLQSSLRSAIDDLSNEQEALHESVVLSQAKSRREVEAIGQRVGALTPALRAEVENFRNEIIANVRDDWRSVRQQIADLAEATQRKGMDREASLTANLEAEFEKLRQVVGRVAASQEVMNEIRHELGIRRDEDAIAELQRLKAELRAAQDRVQKMKSSFSWQITHPFGDPYAG